MRKKLACVTLVAIFTMGVPQLAIGQIYSREGGASEASALGSLLSGALVVGLPVIASMSLIDPAR
jgi:hypothetical protein